MIDEWRCKYCGCFMAYGNNSYLGEGGWNENEGYICNNPKCKLNKQSQEQK